MGTVAPQITSTGIVVPTYEDILAELQNQTWAIFGSDADLDPDTQDGQFLAIFARAQYDTAMTAAAVFNGFSPSFAQGVGLSSLVKINGIARDVATNSTVTVQIVGVAGTTITNGLAGDDLGLGTQWALPGTVVIPLTGEIDVTATCTEVGATPAAANSITQILTPTLGWQTVNNSTAGLPGAPVETDAELRQRQTVSTSLPALTTLESIYAAVADVSGVGRLAIYQNDTDTTDGNGIPSHSISAVVDGGDVQLIAQAIADKKSPGTGTYGTTTEIVEDANGVPNTIRFYQLTRVPLSITVNITALQGYVDTTGDALEAALVAFINGLAIGEDSYLARLYSPANQGGTGLGATYVVTSILQARKPADPTAADVAIAFNEAATLALADITLNVSS